MLAALISFSVGLVLLVVLVLATPRARTGFSRLRSGLRDGALRPWQCLGGLGGAVLVATQGFTVGALGVAVFVVAVVAGQTGTSLVVDKAGLAPGGQHALTFPRVLGATLTLVATIGAMYGRMDTGFPLWLILLPLLAGCAVAVQQAVTGQVSQVAANPLTAALVNFGVGTAALALGWLAIFIGYLTRGQLRTPHGLPSEFWLYLGGPLGVIFIAIAAIVVRWAGVLLFGLATIAGQLSGAVVLDLTVPTQGGGLKPTTVLGAGMALLAVGIAALPSPRRGGRRGT